MAAETVLVALRLQGGRQFAAQMGGATASLQAFDAQAKRTATSGDAMASKRGKWAGALGVVKGAAKGGAIALGAAAGAATLMGLKFNASMEQSQVAFTNLLGSQKASKAMLNDLLELSKKTPFEFPELTQASQKLLGFGMAAKDVLPTMTTIGDAIAGVGGGAAEIESVTRAIGQMQAKGKVSSEELMQLAEAGVPAYKLLADQLGLTGAQLEKKLRAGAVSADEGIGALMKGMRGKYGGMAKAQSKTFAGMLSSMKDSARQILGTLTMPLFTALRDKVFPAINKLFESGKLQAGVKSAMAAIGTAFKAVAPYVTDLFEALKPLAPFVENVLLPVLKGMGIGIVVTLAAALKVLIPLIRIVATVLGWIGIRAKPLRKVFVGIGVVMGSLAAGPILVFRAALGAIPGVFRAIGNAARDAWRWIKNAFTNVVGFFKGVGAKIASATSGMFDGIKDAFRSALNFVIRGWNSLRFGMPGFDPPGPGKFPGFSVGVPQIGELAEGGLVTRPGPFWVGEKGPELLSLPRGAAVSPFGATRIEVPVYLDRRQIALAVADETADRKARR